MEFVFLFFVLPVIALAVFFVPKQYKSAVSMALLCAGIVDTVIILITNDFASGDCRKQFSLGVFNPVFYLDSLSVMFIVLLNIVSLTAFWYSSGYLKSYENVKPAAELSLHLVAYLWLYCSMLGVILFRDTMTFLFFWEMMTGATFILVIFEGEKKEKLKVAINYLIQMHICLFILLAAFSMAGRYSSYSSGFDAVAEYFEYNDNLLLFVLFFIGFGIKAGFVPLHTWLPEVHPSASGNVSGFMSGIVIKMGVYGLLRIIACLQSDLFEIAIIVLTISAITGVYGISGAIRQKDIKRLLAFSSIENIGIIGLGLGMGILGTYWQLPALSFAGYAGALLHTFNHSMFKSLLFFSAGTLCKSTHTQIMDKMGGAIRNLPFTAGAFLAGAVAICALPPLNGFISEFVLYSGLFFPMNGIEPEKTVLLIFIVIALVLIGGMSIFAFTKAFGISFLGTCRNPEHASSPEKKNLVLPLVLPLIMIVFIGFFPVVAVKIISTVVMDIFETPYSFSTYSMILSLNKISFIMMILIALCLVLFFLRKKILSKRTVIRKPTWGCGYTAPSPKLQYTASSFSNNFEGIASSKNGDNKSAVSSKNELFPRKYHTDSELKKQFDFVNNISEKLSKLAIFQTGKIQHYVLFALLFMLIILIISYIT